VVRLLVLVSAFALLMPSAVAAQDPAPADRFEPAGVSGTIDPQILPNALDDSRTLNVMLEMRGDPVAVVQSRDADKSLPRAERDRIKAELRARQDAIKGDIAANGGRVLAQLQSAYNGIKVRIARQDVPALASLPNVIAVRGIQQFTRNNETSVPFLGVPTDAWQDLGVTGEGVKIAVIDTGIDYTHANFGGPGTEAAYDAADAADTSLADTADDGLFGPDAPKVMGGTDLVGDAYDASADEGSPALIPHPDPDPLDCPFTNGSVGHGSHVSGTATGFGVLADGSTYTGPYDSTTHDNEFEIGPGVAPEADLYFVRVFGCDGSTDVTVEAIEWAVDNDMDVINMSLGSDFGRSDDPSAVASTNAAAAGVSVVTSAGNSGPSAYITGSPGTADGSIATAAIDSNQQFPGVVLDLTPGGSINTIAANGVQPPDGTSYDVVVLADDPATTDQNEALGCSVEAYTKAGITEGGGQLAVTERGVCARVARGVYGQQAGAAAVAMINNAASFPPFEGPILSNPDTGEEFEVTIPFLGVQGPPTGSDANALRAADTVSTTAITLANPGFRGFASFSSGGPRNGDSALKPDIGAPGVSTLSTASSTGNKGYVLSGTSMASPHVAGTAALVRQAHPDWTPEEVKAAIVNTGNPAGMAAGTYRVTRAGTGLVSPGAAVGTDVVALGDVIAADPSLGVAQFQTSNLSFGFAELGANFTGTRSVTIRNHGTTPVTLTPSQEVGPTSNPGTLSFGAPSINVPAGGEATLEVTLNVTASTAGSSAAFRHVSGNVLLSGGEEPLRVPYLLVPRALSKVTSSLSGNLNPDGQERTLTATNPGGQIAGAADVYQWGLDDRNDVNEAVFGGGGYDMRAVGAQAFPFNAANQLIVFSISTHDRWSNAAVNEYDILVNNDDDPAAEFAVVGVDVGAILAGSFDGRLGAFVFNLETGTATIDFLAQAPSDSSTLLLPVLSSRLGLTAADGNFEYEAVSFSLEGPGVDPMKGKAGFNPWTPALTNFPFLPVPPNGTASDTIAIDPAAFETQKMLGVMSVVHDNAARAAEAQLIRAPGRPGR
jgi:minor extracellular serine protease Vpr